MKQTFRGGPGKVCYDHRHATDESHGSHSLSKREDIRLPADDFNTGSHLVVGEFVSTDMPVGLEGAEDVLVTSPNTPDPTRDADNREARRALIHARIGTLVSEHIGGDGVSEYPAPSISRENRVVDSAHGGKVTLQ